ncbi:MAG: hypothetical protein AAF485_10125 [Chloroflexota bacterium]
MTELNHLTNGRLLHDLDGWTASGAVYSAGDGDDHYGVAVLTVGDYIEQTFSVRGVRLHTLHFAVKCVGAALSGSQVALTVTDGSGNSVITINPTGSADTWLETSQAQGLAEGTTYTLRITNASAGGDIRLDDVWVWWVPVTRAGIAARVAAKLGRLASDRSLTTTASGALTEGDYTYAVDAGLRNVGAFNPSTGMVDVRYVDNGDLDAVIEATERYLLEQLQRDYSSEVDLRVGPRSESRSQKATAIADVLGQGREGGAPGTVVTRRMRYE